MGRGSRGRASGPSPVVCRRTEAFDTAADLHYDVIMPRRCAACMRATPLHPRIDRSAGPSERQRSTGLDGRRVGAAAPTRVPHVVDGLDRLEHRLVDARGRRGLAHDLARAHADIVDRRRQLIVAQTWMMITASVLGVLTLAGWITAPLLLLLTFSLGVGTAMTMPAWGAIVPELIARPQLPAANALNSVGMNISRTVGPALAGVIVAATGPGAVFCLNALSFLAVLLALRSWQRPPRKSDLPAERLIGAIRAGLRYARHSPELRAVLTRGIGFFVFASASWALLPLI